MAGYVEFSFGGQVRHFRLKHAALEKLEEVERLASFTDLVTGNVKMSARLTASILWCALLAQEPSLTRDQVVGWIDEADDTAGLMNRAVEVLNHALESFAEFGRGNPPTPPSAGTGGPPDAPPSASG